LLVLIIAHAGAGQVFTRNDHAFFDQQHTAAFFVRQQFCTGRNATGSGLSRRNAVIDHLECKLCRAANNALELLRVAFTRSLHNDAVDALTHDRRLFGTKRVDTAADHFDRRINSRLRFNGLTRLGQAQGYALIIRAFDFKAGRSPRNRRREAGDRLESRVNLRGLIDAHIDRIARDAQVGKFDATVTQPGAYIFGQIGLFLREHVVGIDFEQQIRPALQVKPKVQSLRRNEPGHAGTHRRRQKVGQGNIDADQGDYDNQPHLPARKFHHGVLGSAA
jgi:hypothetical protein